MARLGRVHDRALDAAMRIHEGAPADRALEATFRGARDLGSSERAEISDLIYDLVRARRRIDDRLERGLRAEGRKLELLDPPIATRLRLLVVLHDRGADLAALEARDPYAFKRVPALFRRLAKGDLPAPKKRPPAERIGVEGSLPDWLAARMIEAFGEERTLDLASRLLSRAPLTLRANTLRNGRDGLRQVIAAQHGIDAEPTHLAPDGLLLPDRAGVEGWELYREGAFELQDEGSQLLALALGARSGETILDACAGAGGKTLALGAAMGNKGRLVALDPDGDRLEELLRRARRAGLTNHETVKGDLVLLPKNLEGRADRVLIDAPCTGSGVFRRHPDARWRVTEAEAKRLAPIQAGLLERAFDAVRPGGIVLYATCSILPEENERRVDAFLERTSRAERVPLSETLGADLAARLDATHQAWIGPGPTARDPDGFYLALLRRR